MQLYAFQCIMNSFGGVTDINFVSIFASVFFEKFRTFINVFLKLQHNFNEKWSKLFSSEIELNIF